MYPVVMCVYPVGLCVSSRSVCIQILHHMIIDKSVKIICYATATQNVSLYILF